MDKFKWSNIPIPPGHVITLVTGIALHIWRPLEFWQAVSQRQFTGWILLILGILLGLWGTVAFKDMDFEKPTAIITVGSYAFSRNPMYGARTLIYLAFALLVNTWCLIILLPVLLFFMHYHVGSERSGNWKRSLTMSICNIVRGCGDVYSKTKQTSLQFSQNKRFIALITGIYQSDTEAV